MSKLGRAAAAFGAGFLQGELIQWQTERAQQAELMKEQRLREYQKSDIAEARSYDLQRDTERVQREDNQRRETISREDAKLAEEGKRDSRDFALRSRATEQSIAESQARPKQYPEGTVFGYATTKYPRGGGSTTRLVALKDGDEVPDNFTPLPRGSSGSQSGTDWMYTSGPNKGTTVRVPYGQTPPPGTVLARDFVSGQSEEQSRLPNSITPENVRHITGN